MLTTNAKDKGGQVVIGVWIDAEFRKDVIVCLEEHRSGQWLGVGAVVELVLSSRYDGMQYGNVYRRLVRTAETLKSGP